MNDVAVIVPYRGGCPYRAAALTWVVKRWLALPCATSVHVVTDAEAGPWRKGWHVAEGLRRTTAEIVVVADADSWAPGVGEAIAMVRDGAPWAMGSTHVARLNERATELVLAGAAPEDVAARPTNLIFGERYEQVTAGGVVVLRRDVAEAVPMDPRFAGWGYEDEAWRFALEAVAGPRLRAPGTMYHLWHPPAARDVAARAYGLALKLRYRRAHRKPDAMRALLAEAHTQPGPCDTRPSDRTSERGTCASSA